jgi:hypothetical protein
MELVKSDSEKKRFSLSSRNRESPTYRALMEEREREIMSLPGSDERWFSTPIFLDFLIFDILRENWMQFIMMRRVPSFTENGFLKTRVPPKLFKKIKDAFNAGMVNFDKMNRESFVDVIYNPPGFEPKMLHLGALAKEVQSTLLPLHEAWAGGIQLQPTSIYGVRIYQNGSSLVMHVDKVHSNQSGILQRLTSISLVA